MGQVIDVGTVQSVLLSDNNILENKLVGTGKDAINHLLELFSKNTEEGTIELATETFFVELARSHGKISVLVQKKAF